MNIISLGRQQTLKHGRITNSLYKGTDMNCLIIINVMNTLQLQWRNVEACAFFFQSLKLFNCYSKNRYILFHKGISKYNAILFKHERNIRTYHYYVRDRIHARTLSFWRRHCIVIWLKRTDKWIKEYTVDGWIIWISKSQ